MKEGKLIANKKESYDDEIISSDLILNYFNEGKKRTLYKRFVEAAIAPQMDEAT